MVTAGIEVALKSPRGPRPCGKSTIKAAFTAVVVVILLVSQKVMLVGSAQLRLQYSVPASTRDRQLFDADFIPSNKPPTLFCFCVVSPAEVEQFLPNAIEGLSKCTAFQLYSNESVLHIAPGRIAEAHPAVTGSMTVQRGGRFGTAMNTPIFKQVYRYMFTQQWEEIAGYDWVVKVDADTVMLPDRLQRQLRSRDPRQGMVLGSKLAWVGSPKSGQSYAAGLDGPVIPISRAVSMS